MIITEEVEVSLGGSNILYYKNLGYNIPTRKNKWGEYTTPRGTKILVKVKDLSKSSTAQIECYCEKCLDVKKYSIVKCEYRYYYKKKNKGEPILCKNCTKIKISNFIKNSSYMIERQRIGKRKEKYNNNLRKIKQSIREKTI